VQLFVLLVLLAFTFTSQLVFPHVQVDIMEAKEFAMVTEFLKKSF